MAYQLSSHTPLHQPAVSPYASSSHKARGTGHGLWSSRHSLKVTAPLLLVGICAAIALAFTPFNSAGEPKANAYVTQTNTASSVDSQVANTTSANPSDQAAGNSLNVSVSSGGGNQSSVNTKVTVNGQPVDVPANGSTQQTVTNPDGSSTSYSVSASTNGGADNSSFTSTNLSVSSDSYSNSGGGTSGYTVINGVPYFY